MNIEVPANLSLLRYFKSRAQQPAGADHTKIEGTHPDLVERLWQELGGLLPEDCHAIVYGTPVLMRPSSAIVFAFAGGSHTYALRLPADVRTEAMTAGAGRVHLYPAYPELGIAASSFSLDEIGDEWVFGGWLKGEEQWVLAAYEYATNL